MRRLSIVFAVIALALLGQATQQTITGKVVHVTDGDTVIVQSGQIKTIIRLDGIDAPESDQQKGKESAGKLQELVLDKEVSVSFSEKDKYGRTIGRIYVEDTWVNLEMVKSGYAWHYKKYSKDETLAEAEKAARKNEVGVWEDDKPVPPWRFRRIMRQRMNPLYNPPKPGEDAVYVTRYGSKYHKEDCQYVRHGAIAIGLEYAKSRYEPCLVCEPPK